MGYEVEKLKLYSLQDNQVYEVPLPDEQETQKFEEFLESIRNYTPLNSSFSLNPEKCKRCIYHELCDEDASKSD